ncbi:MAG: type II toxin-antitoxin system RelE/ParE family toxin [Janthinobacterium lividum]
MGASPSLSREALADLRRELKKSREVFGPAAARRMGARLARSLNAIATGTALGHRHSLLHGAPVDFMCVTVAPLLIIYNARTRSVLTIVDGRRDIAAVVAERLSQT